MAMGGLKEHPDELELAAWVEGQLDQDAAAAIHRHLETCDRCRLLTSDPTVPESRAGADVPGYLRAVLVEHGLTMHIFSGEDAPVLADVTPSILPAPPMPEFFERARENAVADTVQTMDAAGLSISVSVEPRDGLVLELAGRIDSFWLGIDGWRSRSEVPLEPGRQVYRISGIPAPESLETSIVRDGVHYPLRIEVSRYEQIGTDPGRQPVLVRAAARALASGRITAFAGTVARFRDDIPALGWLAAVIDGWRALYPALWVRTVLLGRRVMRGASEADGEIDAGRVAALQPWLPFEEELAVSGMDTHEQADRNDTAFINLVRQKLCAQVLQYYDETWVELMADPEIFRIRAWLLFAGGNPGESLHCMERALLAARAKGAGGKEFADICLQEHSLLSAMDPGDGQRWPIVPQDIFETFWKIGTTSGAGHKW